MKADKIVKLQAFDSRYFCGKSHFEDNGTQNYLVFQPVYKYFKKIANNNHILAWKSQGLTDEMIKPYAASNDSLAPALNHINTILWGKFDGSCLKQEKALFTYKQVVNIYIVYEIYFWPFTVGNDITLRKFLFGAVKLTKNADFDKYKYSGYGIGFDARGSFSLSDGSGFAKNVII